MKYFEKEEFCCPCPDCDLDFGNMDEDVIRDLGLARRHAGVPFVITSSVRCMKHNLTEEVGGSETSSHLGGWAVDIEARTSYARYMILEGLLKAGFNRFGMGKNFIHADRDPDKPKKLMWTY